MRRVGGCYCALLSTGQRKWPCLCSCAAPCPGLPACLPPVHDPRRLRTRSRSAVRLRRSDPVNSLFRSGVASRSLVPFAIPKVRLWVDGRVQPTRFLVRPHSFSPYPSVRPCSFIANPLHQFLQ